MVKIAYSSVYKYELPEGHRFPMIKYELIPEQLLYEGSVTDDHFFHPDQLTDDEIRLTHTNEYLQKLNNLTLDRKEVRNIGFPVAKSLIERGKYIANGTLQCARYAINEGCAMNIAGGTHHSFADRGEGFCIFNDIAISANILMDEGVLSRILVVDLDVHQGNGTAKIFEEDDRVFTFSMHGERNYPTRKETSNLDIGLADKSQDAAFLNPLKSTLPRLIEKLEPEFIFYLSGVDILESDKLGRLSVSKEGCRERDRFVFEQCKANNIPVAVSMGGGYSPKISDIVDAHANTFRSALDVYE